MNSSTVIIIGAGPAGIACAIQLIRHNIDAIIFEKESIGGLLKNANLIENYPGFPKGVSGDKLVQLLGKQVKSNELNIIYENVELVQHSNIRFVISTDKKSYESEYIVLASGTKPIIPSNLELSIKDKIYTDIYKLGNVEKKSIAIIGAGDCAFDYALNLSSHNDVIILNRSDKTKALPILQERVFNNKNIKYFDNTVVQNLELLNNKLYLTYAPDNVKQIVDYLLIAIGREPNLDFVSEELLNNPNLFQIGDVKNGLFRQTSIAIGDGTFTAMKINSMLT